MVTLRSTCPVTGLAHSSVCEPPTQTVPPLTAGAETRPPPGPVLTRATRGRPASGANQVHSDMPTPAVPQTPPVVATRFPAELVISVIAEDPSWASVARL